MTEKELETRMEATKFMVEFVIKINRSFAAPVVNTGVIMPIKNNKDKVETYFVVNTEEFGSFFTTEQLVVIESSIKNNKPNLISEINPKIRCVKCPDFINISTIKTDPAADILVGISLKEMYANLPHSTVGAAEYSNFVSRFHVYFTNVPAGINIGTRILLVPNSVSFSEWNKLNERKYYLIGFHPDLHKLIVKAENTTVNLMVDPDKFTLADEKDELKAGVAQMFVNAFSRSELKEAQYIKTIQDLKAKIPAPVPQAAAPVDTKPIKVLPPKKSSSRPKKK